MVILRPVGTIGNRLKYLRKIRGLTREEAAVKLDMKEERLQDLETGRKGLTLGEAIKYADTYNLAYCVNVYLHPGITQFFFQRGITMNEDLYGLSEMIQWIWRSRIRKGESINIYIPSMRMRNLLFDWMKMNLQYQHKKAS